MNQQFAPPGAADIHSDAFKAVMRNVAGAVSIITASHAGERADLTALAAEPPTVIVCIGADEERVYEFG